MIRAASWFGSEDYGVFIPGEICWKKSSPALTETAEILALIDRPVKYFSRMPTETRMCLCAASIALRAVTTPPSEDREIGVLCAGGEGVLQANHDYFRDYVATGRTMGRGNLFIYTLPTSAVGEVAIALSLAGPCMFLRADSIPLAYLVQHSQQLVADHEADLMLALWSDAQRALCIAVDANAGDDAIAALLGKSDQHPWLLIHALQKMVSGA